MGLQTSWPEDLFTTKLTSTIVGKRTVVGAGSNPVAYGHKTLYTNHFPMGQFYRSSSTSASTRPTRTASANAA